MPILWHENMNALRSQKKYSNSLLWKSKTYTITHTHTQSYKGLHVSFSLSNVLCAAASPLSYVATLSILKLWLMSIFFATWLWSITFNLCNRWEKVHSCLPDTFKCVIFKWICFPLQVFLTCLNINNHLMAPSHSWSVIFSITWRRNNILF